MAKVSFNVGCTAVYCSELEIPNEIVGDNEAILKYIHEHLSECPRGELEWIADLEPEDAVEMDDILS